MLCPPCALWYSRSPGSEWSLQPESGHQTHSHCLHGGIWALGLGLDIPRLDHPPTPAVSPPQGHVVLTDFGLCKEGVEPEATTCTFCGTPEVSVHVPGEGRP